jgi:hypothetical protein
MSRHGTLARPGSFYESGDQVQVEAGPKVSPARLMPRIRASFCAHMPGRSDGLRRNCSCRVFIEKSSLVPRKTSNEPYRVACSGWPSPHIPPQSSRKLRPPSMPPRQYEVASIKPSAVVQDVRLNFDRGRFEALNVTLNDVL